MGGAVRAATTELVAWWCGGRRGWGGYGRRKQQEECLWWRDTQVDVELVAGEAARAEEAWVDLELFVFD